MAEALSGDRQRRMFGAPASVPPRKGICSESRRFDLTHLDWNQHRNSREVDDRPQKRTRAGFFLLWRNNRT